VTVDAVDLAPLSGDDGLVDAAVAPGAAAEGRITFDLSVRNASGGPIVLENPYQGASYHLIDGSGNPVQVDEPPSQAKVHVARDPAERRRYLQLTSATVDGTSVAPHEFVGTRTVELGPGAEVLLSLAIEAAIDVSDRSVQDRVPAGDYQLVVMVRTIAEADDERHPLLLRTAQDVAVTVA
jgi:hypothetical protein